MPTVEEKIQNALNTNATELDLSRMRLNRLPDSIGNLTNLQRLSIGHNQLTTLPDSIGNLTILKELYVYENQLTTLHDSIGNLTNLNTLYIGSNQLTTLPDSIGNLTNLKELNVYGNQLTTLPDSIGNLTNLTFLNVYGNQLTTLPDSIGSLTNLKKLDVGDNQLTTLHDSIGNMTNLEKLDVRYNQLTTLPESIGNLTNLRELNVEENENLTIRRSLFNSMENNGAYIRMNDDVTIIEDVQGDVPEAPVSTLSPSVPAPIQSSPSTSQPVQPSNNQIKQEVLNMNKQLNALTDNMYSNTTIDINTTISFSDPITLDDFNGTIKEYINENINNMVFVVKENNDTISYFLTNRGNIQRVLNESTNILYPCIETGTMRSDNIEKDMKLFNLRSLGFHTSLQFCFMNVYEKLPQQLQVFVIENTGLTYPSYVSDDVLNQGGSYISAMHCQDGYEQSIAKLTLPENIIDSTPQQGGKKKKTKKGKRKHMKKGKKKTKKRKGKGKKHMKGKKKTRKGKRKNEISINNCSV